MCVWCVLQLLARWMMKPHHIPQADSAAELFQAAVAQGGMPVIYTDGCWDKKIPRAFCATGYDQIFYRGGLT